jgi:chromosomal replication initiation ATPase DnaA
MYPYSAIIRNTPLRGVTAVRPNPDQVENFVKNVEKKLSLPPGTLKTKRGKTGRPKNIEGTISVSTIRMAAVYHLLNEIKTPFGPVAEKFGLHDHTGVSYIKRKAEDLIEVDDEKFMNYYRIIQTIAV